MSTNWNLAASRRGQCVHSAVHFVTALNEGEDVTTIALLTSHSDLKAMMPYIQLHNKGKGKVIDAIDAAFERE